MEILVEPGELDLVPADPDPEPETPAAQHIEAGRLLGDQRGLALRQDQHLGREILDLGDRGEEPEQHKGVVVEVGRAAALLGPARTALGVGPEHVVRERDPLIPDRFRRLHKIADRIGLSADIDDRQGHAELHLPLRSDNCVSLRA